METEPDETIEWLKDEFIPASKVYVHSEGQDKTEAMNYINALLDAYIDFKEEV